MKKLTLISSLLLILALVLGACADTNNGDNDVDGLPTEAGFETQPALDGEPTAMMETPDVEATATADLAATPAASIEATMVMTDTTGVVDDDDQHRASNLLDFTVKDYQGETIGEVDDIVVNMNGEQMTYVIVEFGGFLGLGEKQVAVPYDRFTLGGAMDDKTAMFDDGRAFHVDLTAEQLENAPDFDENDIEFTTVDWDVDIVNFWIDVDRGVDVTTNDNDNANDNANANDNDNDDDDANDNDDDDDAYDDDDDANDNANMNDNANESTDMDDSTMAASPQAVLLSVLLDSNVVAGAMASADDIDYNDNANANDNTNDTTVMAGDEETLGEVEELIVDPQTGQVMYVVIEAGGVLNIGDVWIPVPMSELTILSDEDNDLFENEYTIHIDRELLASAPNYDRGLLPAFDIEGWDAGLRDYWEVQ